MKSLNRQLTTALIKKRYFILIFLAAFVAFLLLSGEIPVQTAPVSTSVHNYSKSQSYSYQKDIKPILAQKCIACHGCYDAPCQLKLTSSEGLARGASQESVYDAKRLLPIRPTRLFVDALSPAAWRKKGFFSVINESHGDPVENLEQSLLYKMLTLGKEHPVIPRSKIPDEIKLGLTRENSCPKLSEFDDYAYDNPSQGMPLAITGLDNAEYQTLRTWIEQGALIDEAPSVISTDEKQSIVQWEKFLNQPANKNRLVSRYIYEHLFLAHLYFETLHSDHYFKLVRSSTATGKPVNIISSRRPNNDPGKTFYYWLQKIGSIIVHKTHIIYPLSNEKLARLQQLFLSDDWTLNRLPDYSAYFGANPHITFNAIPAHARYQFLLDNADYFVRTFIRGPVCRGQVATNVLNDHFYVLFQDPDHDLSVINHHYEKIISPLLTMPEMKPGRLPAGADYLDVQENWKKYSQIRSESYRRFQPSGATLENIWDGDHHNQSAALTVFRNFDNSSVTEGFVGKDPKTIWLIDYPLFENTYYSLVVNFDVFGSVFLQASTRMYFDLIRNSAENNFLQFVPVKARQKLRDDWYQGKLAQIKSYLAYTIDNKNSPAGIKFKSNDPKSEFISLVLDRLSPLNYSEDRLNRCNKLPCIKKEARAFQSTVESSLETLTSQKASQSDMQFINYMPEISFLRFSSAHKEQGLAYTLIRNKDHQNVAFMFKEETRREPKNDTMTAYRGLLGSYPNFFFNIPEERVGDFVHSLHRVQGKKSFMAIIEQYGISRSHPKIWDHFRWFSDYMRQHHPREAGIYDLNRYQKVNDLLSGNL